jgi:hypothetical protein
MHNHQATPQTIRGLRTNKAHGPKASMAHRTTIPSHPRAHPVSLEGKDTASQKLPASFEGPGPSGEFPPRSRASVPRASLRLARGPLNPWCPTSPDRSIKRSGPPRAPGPKAYPRHADLLTQLGNPALALFEQPAITRPSPVLCRYCAGWWVSFLGTVLPALILPPHRTP